MRHLTIDTFLKELGEDTGGISKPVLVVASDGERYVLKNQRVQNESTHQWEHYDCMFLQEYLVYKLCEYLNIPTPEVAIINIEKIHLEHAPALPFTHRYQPGEHFGSKFLKDIDNNLIAGYQLLMKMGRPYTVRSWNNFFKNILNPKDIAKIISLDLLIGNFDRFGNEGNLMIAGEYNTRKVFAIDHGHAFFGAQWNSDKIRYLTQDVTDQRFPGIYLSKFHQYSGRILSGMGHIFKAIEQHVDVIDLTNHDFKGIVLAIESINEDLLDSWFDDVPNSWFVDKLTQIALYKKFLLHNKNNLRTLINMMIRHGAFSNTNGGLLEWRDTKASIL